VLTAATFVSNLHFYLPVFVFYLQQRGLSLAEVNALQFAALLSTAIFEVPTGIFGDRFGRRTSVVLGTLCLAASEAMMLVAHAFWHFVALQVVLGIGFAFISGSIQAMLVDSIATGPQHDLHVKRALGTVGAARHLGGITSFALAGLLFPDTQLTRYFWPIAATAGALCLGALLMMAAREQRAPVAAHHERPPGSLALLRNSLHELRHDATLRRIVALSVFSEPLGFYWIALYQPVLAASAVPTAWFGPALAAGALLAALVEHNAARIESRLPPRSGLSLLLLAPAVLYGALALPHAPIVTTVLFVLQHGTMYLSRPLLGAYTNARIDSAHRATALSLISLLNTIYLSALGLPLGALADWSLPATCLAIAALITLGVLLFRPIPATQRD
jgi:MFS family permease